MSSHAAEVGSFVRLSTDLAIFGATMLGLGVLGALVFAGGLALGTFLFAGLGSLVVFATLIGAFVMRVWRRAARPSDLGFRAEPFERRFRKLVLFAVLTVALIAASRIINGVEAAGICSAVWIGTALALLGIAYALARKEMDAGRTILIGMNAPWFKAPTLSVPRHDRDPEMR